MMKANVTIVVTAKDIKELQEKISFLNDLEEAGYRVDSYYCWRQGVEHDILKSSETKEGEK